MGLTMVFAYSSFHFMKGMADCIIQYITATLFLLHPGSITFLTALLLPKDEI
jgi:hypothetical protein